jgi:hypothetical protein
MNLRCNVMLVSALCVSIACGGDDDDASTPGSAGAAGEQAVAGAAGTAGEPGAAGSTSSGGQGPVGCGAGMFECGSGECILGTLFCDGTNDCADGSDENCTPLEPFRVFVESVELDAVRDWDLLGNQPDPYVCVQADGETVCTSICSDAYQCSWGAPLDMVVQPPVTLAVTVYDDDVDAADIAGETSIAVEEYRAGDEQAWTLSFDDVSSLVIGTAP